LTKSIGFRKLPKVEAKPAKLPAKNRANLQTSTICNFSDKKSTQRQNRATTLILKALR
jgi:hypothetical protein